jgi:hypothetical protein
VADDEALAAVAEALYALPPEGFTAARDAAAKADPGRKRAIAALRRPTVSAWVVNTLAREDPDLLGQLLDLGPALAEAQRSGQGAELRQLSEQRRALVGAVVDRAVELSGRPATAAVRAEVEGTLDAALADPAVAEVVRSGQLVRGLSFAGFGGVDLEGATATTVLGRPGARAGASAAAARGTGAVTPSETRSGKATSKTTGRVSSTAAREAKEAAAAEARERKRLAVAAAEEAALTAAGELDDAVRAHDAAQQRLSAAATASDEAEQRVRDLEAELERAREEATASRQAAQEADHDLARAARAVSRAQTVAERARAELDRLRRD